MAVYKNRNIEEAENVEGGTGTMLRDRLLKESQMGGICSYVVHNALKPGASIGDHEHNGETETYYVTNGKGLYNDNGVEVEIEKGDLLFCDDGEHHAISNTGDELLSFVVIIQKTA